jgi:hypothetical protein
LITWRLRSRSPAAIPIDSWVARVVPPSSRIRPEWSVDGAGGSVQTFVRINSDLRRRTRRPSRRWRKRRRRNDGKGRSSRSATPLSKRNSRFGPTRSRERKSIGYLGFDLAVTQHVPILAAPGVIVHAAYSASTAIA